MEMATAFGAFLDPVADKLMVSTALILLAAAPPAPLGSAITVVPVLVIIGREIAMSSLREWAAASGGNAHKVHLQLMLLSHVCRRLATHHQAENHNVAAAGLGCRLWQHRAQGELQSHTVLTGLSSYGKATFCWELRCHHLH